MARIQLCFVCLGNICRSPTAEGVMRDLVVSEGLAEQVELDSAGTGSWHIGSAPDERATAAAAGRGISLEGGARQVEPADLERFDLIIAMDRQNLADLRAMAEHPRQEEKLALLREFDQDGLEAAADAHVVVNREGAVGGQGAAGGGCGCN